MNGNDVVVPGAERQDVYRLADLTTKGTEPAGRTVRADWQGLNVAATRNREGPVPGVQVDGYFPDDVRNADSNPNNGYDHDAQFVLRLPDGWNGGLVVAGSPGVRRQYANDHNVSDFVLAKGYAFASTDKGNGGPFFFRHGGAPGGSVAEWHYRLEQLTRAAKAAVEGYYGEAPHRTYVAGISNGGYLARYALENTPGLYDGGVDWEGSLFRAEGPNLLTYLPTALRSYPRYKDTGDRGAFEAMVRAGFAPGSEFLWGDYYGIYWDLTQRVYREEFDPSFDGDLEAGVPFCEPGTPNCDADYDYFARPTGVREAVRRVELTGDIGKPLLTVHGTLDTLLPVSLHSDVYAGLVERAGRSGLHRYYRIEGGDHVDGFHDRYGDRVRPMLPAFRAAFEALEGWVERGEDPPEGGLVPRPEGGDPANECSLAVEGRA